MLTTEKECLCALSGRTIESIEFGTPEEEVIIIKTHDGLTFKIDSVDGCRDGRPWLTIDQVK